MYKLSKTGKMPGKSWSIPASTCKIGSLLSKLENSVCSKCYAKKGSYCYPNAKNLRQNNFDHYLENKETFVEDMKTIIQAEYLKTGVEYFRWFDSGDLQSTKMLEDIIRIAYLLPHIKFWLPTKERKVVEEVLSNFSKIDCAVPSNLSIRLSVYMIDGSYIDFEAPEMAQIKQTRVISKDREPLKEELVCSGECIPCGYACWKNTKNVAYIKH